MKWNLLDGRARLADSSSSASVRRVFTRVARRSIKAAATPGLAGARSVGIFGLPRGATRADDVLAVGATNGIRGRRIDLREPRRVLRDLGAGDPCPETQPVTTSLTILDDPAGRFAFGHNLVADHRQRIVFPWDVDDDGKPVRFRDLRVSWTRLPDPRRVAGSVAYLSNAGVQNFGHWLLSVFPLVQHYRDYLGGDPDWYYVGTPVEDWHYDSLAALGIDPGRVLTDAVTGDRMVAAVVDRPIPPPTSFLDFSTSTLRRRPRRESAPGRRIYISRKLRPTRPFLNEEACLEVLEAHGFESVCTETLSLREETELFADAEVVVAVHGAGLTNLLFCHPGCVVVELFPHGYPSPWFVEVSAVRGITYANLRGLPTPKAGLRPRHYHLLVDVDRLNTVVAAAIAAFADHHPGMDPLVGGRASDAG